MTSGYQINEIVNGAEAPLTAVRTGYLTSGYPAISHTFILREILELRKLGCQIETVSINLPDRPPSGLTPVERAEADSTFYIKKQGVIRAGLAVLRILLRRPVKAIKAFFFALGLGNGSPRELLRNVFYFFEAALLGEWLERKGLKHLHVHFGNAASTVAMIAARAFPFTFSITIHGPDEFYEVERHALRQKTENAAFVVCIGHFARSQVMKVSSPSKWSGYHVLPLGVDPEEFGPAPVPRAGSGCELVCVGRLTPAKGQMILLRALKILVQEGRTFQCRFIGDGPDRKVLTEFAAAELPPSCITFQGATNPDRVVGFLREASLFVLPSFAEGVPVALMEAMAMEVPCISTVVAGIPELIRNGIDGILVPPSDEIELAAAIRRLMDDENLRRRLGAAGRARVIERYNLRKNVRELARVLACELS
jgi:glycosyltransferase involved in cell wall biosynthesis